jgi:hypothetical protein
LTHFEASFTFAFTSAFLRFVVVLRRLAVEFVAGAYGCCLISKLLEIESEGPGNSIKVL